MDLEVLDEDAFATFGGFSVGFTRAHVRLGTGRVEAAITVNSRQFEFDEVVRECEPLARGEHTFEVVERVEKADLVTIAIVTIAVFMISQTFGGFFSALGASLFERVMRLRRKDHPEAAIEVQFHLHLHKSRNTPMVIIVIDPGCEASDVATISEEELLRQIQEVVDLEHVTRAVARLRAGATTELEVIVDGDGRNLER